LEVILCIGLKVKNGKFFVASIIHSFLHSNRVELFDGEQTVFEAEMHAILRVIQICQSEDRPVEIRTDSRNAIEGKNRKGFFRINS
jgi:hypothetical protein